MPARGKKHVVVTTLDGSSGDVDDHLGVDQVEAASALSPPATTEVAKTKRTASAAQLEALKRARDRAKALRDDARGQTTPVNIRTTNAAHDTPTTADRPRKARAKRATGPAHNDDVVDEAHTDRETVNAPKRKRMRRPASTEVVDRVGNTSAAEGVAPSKRTRRTPRDALPTQPARASTNNAPTSEAAYESVTSRDPSPPPTPPAPPPPPPPPPSPPRPGFMRSVDGLFFFNRDE